MGVTRFVLCFGHASFKNTTYFAVRFLRMHPGMSTRSSADQKIRCTRVANEILVLSEAAIISQRVYAGDTVLQEDSISDE